jgi:toxin ParE1/3/4
MTIEWAEGATRQLLAAHAYVAEKNLRAADKLLLRIMQAVRHLGVQPRLGRPGRVRNTRELAILNTPYIVAYRIKEEVSVQILAVFHGRRRWPPNF